MLTDFGTSVLLWLFLDTLRNIPTGIKYSMCHRCYVGNFVVVVTCVIIIVMNNSYTTKDLIVDSKLFVNKVLSYDEIDSPLQQCAFHANIRTNISSKEDVKRWVAEFSEKTGTGWIVLKTFPTLERLDLRICVMHFICLC